MKPLRRLVRRRTAAEELGTSISMMKRLERDGKLTPIRLRTRDVFYPAEQVAALAAER
jgi:predicted site-specific integrase-resolvase